MHGHGLLRQPLTKVIAFMLYHARVTRRSYECLLWTRAAAPMCRIGQRSPHFLKSSKPACPSIISVPMIPLRFLYLQLTINA